jgi:uroporphyrinogen-III synthase
MPEKEASLLSSDHSEHAAASVPPPSPLRPSVLLLRGPDDADGDPYTALLQSAGLPSACTPALHSSVFGVPALRAALAALSPLPSCVVLTSRRASTALSSALASLPTSCSALAAQLRSLPVLCVGAHTAGGLDPSSPVGGDLTSYAGSAAALLPLVLQAALPHPQQPVLFVCGERRLDTIPAGLQAAGLPVLEFPVYRTEPLPPAQLQQGWAAALATLAPHAQQQLAVVLFSPSGVEAAVQAGLLPHPSARLVAIGPTTAQALAAAALPCAAVADTPTPQGVLAAVQRALA